MNAVTYASILADLNRALAAAIDGDANGPGDLGEIIDAIDGAIAATQRAHPRPAPAPDAEQVA